MARRQLEPLRTQVTTAIQHGTDLLADLQGLVDRFPVLVPDLAERTEAKRWAEVARLCGLDEAAPDRLSALVESLADVLGGLTSDGGAAWLEHRRAALEDGEDDERAAAA